MIDGLFADYLLGDKGYDTNEIIEWAIEHGMIAVIPPKKNRLDQREYDEYSRVSAQRLAALRR